MKEKQLYLGLTAVHFGFAQRALKDDDNTHWVIGLTKHIKDHANIQIKSIP